MTNTRLLTRTEEKILGFIDEEIVNIERRLNMLRELYDKLDSNGAFNQVECALKLKEQAERLEQYKKFKKEMFG